jgi:hypothetical protein
MVRAIIFIKGKNWVDTKAKLEQIHETSGSFFTEHCAVMEFYIEAFGNPDFIVSLWSTNIELSLRYYIFAISAMLILLQ